VGPASSNLRPVSEPSAGAAPAAPLPPSDPFDLRALLHVLLKRRASIAVVGLLIFAAIAVRTLRLEKTYTAAVSLVIELHSPKVLGDQVQDVGESAASFWQSKEFIETQFRILKSHAVAERVVRKLGLDRDASFLHLDRIEDPQRRAEALAKADAVSTLRVRTKIDPVRDSRVVSVLIEDRDPKRAALIANTLADEFIAFNLEEKRGTSRSASEWLRGQIEQLQGHLAQSEQALYQFKREHEIFTATIEDSQSIVARRLSAISDALTKVRQELASLEGKAKVVRDERAKGSLASLPQVLSSAVVQAHRARAQQLGEELAELAARYGPDHPKLDGLQKRREAAVALAAQEEERIARAVEIELDELRAAERNLVALLASAKREASEVNKEEVDFNRLRREQETSAKIVDLVTKRLKDVDLASLLRTNNVRVLDAAEAPLYPSAPNLKVALLLAALAAVVLGVGQALLREQLDNTVKTQEDLEHAARAAFLGLIPAVKPADLQDGETADLYVHRKPKSPVAECCRTVRTNLLFLGTERPLQRLLVTSSGPQEGKTTAVIDLGVTFAQSGQRVLLVDTDLRRPRLHRAFGLSGEVGLSSVLLDEKLLASALQATAVPGVTVLPCGPLPPNPAELLHTERFRQLVAELSRRFDRVIFDSPPIGAVTDAQILASEVDGVVLLAKAGKTTKEGVQRARRALHDVGARVAGAILNAVDLEDRSAGYYYYYYERYGGYYGDKDGRAAQ
jgi:capsular exopolysaccharide synthesis family protein